MGTVRASLKVPVALDVALYACFPSTRPFFNEMVACISRIVIVVVGVVFGSANLSNHLKDHGNKKI